MWYNKKTSSNVSFDSHTHMYEHDIELAFQCQPKVCNKLLTIAFLSKYYIFIVFFFYYFIRDCIVPLDKQNDSVTELGFHNYNNYNVQCVKAKIISKVYLYQHTGCVVLQKTIHLSSLCLLHLVPTSGSMQMAYSITYHTAFSYEPNVLYITIYKSNETVTKKHSPGIKPDSGVHNPEFNCGMIILQQQDYSPYIASLHYQMLLGFKDANYSVYHMREGQDPRFPVHMIGQVQFHLTASCTGLDCNWSEVTFKFEDMYFKKNNPAMFLLRQSILSIYMYSDIECSQLIADTTRLVVSTYTIYQRIRRFTHTDRYIALTNESLQLKAYYKFLMIKLYSLYHNTTSCTIYMNFGYIFYLPTALSLTGKNVKPLEVKECTLVVSISSRVTLQV